MLGNFRWNDETDGTMLRMQQEGRSASEIATHFGEQYGTFVSRSAVIGRLYRLRGYKRDAPRNAPKPPRLQPRRFVWSPVTVQRFRELVEDGYPSAEIASRMAISFPILPQLTISAVTARASVMGLKIRNGNKARIRPYEPKPEIKPESIVVIEAPAAPAPVEDEGPIGLMDLRDGRCRFPVGMPDVERGQLFCGAPSDPAKPYCPSCAKLAYRPSPPRSVQQEAAIEKRRMAMLKKRSIGKDPYALSPWGSFERFVEEDNRRRGQANAL